MNETEGVWAVYFRDYRLEMSRVYPGTVEGELDARRSVQRNGGYERVVFLPYGATLNDVDAEG